MSDPAPARVPDQVLEDLRRRLQATRRPTLPRGLGWEHGTDEAYLADLVEYWATAYDWRPHEERIRALSWERAGQLNVVHQRADDDTAPAVVLLHGWPDLVLRFQRVLPLLDDVHVIVPALPGYPFADPLVEPGMSATRMADHVAEAVAALGYDRVVVSGGDIGAMVGEALGARHAERLAALHLTDIPFVHLANLGDDAALSPAERELFDHGDAWQRLESGYSAPGRPLRRVGAP